LKVQTNSRRVGPEGTFRASTKHGLPSLVWVKIGHFAPESS
jgi:hypothetical protein